MDLMSGTFAGFGFSPILLSGSSGIAVSCNVHFSQYVRFLISTCGVFSFSFHMPILSYAVYSSCFLVLFMQSQCMNLLYQHAAIPVGFFKVYVTISCYIFMSELLFGLCFCCRFQQNSQVFVSSKCVLWLAPEQKLFYGNFCYLALLSVYWNQGLNFVKFFMPWSCLLCVLWLQSRSCFTEIFCYLTLSSILFSYGDCGVLNLLLPGLLNMFLWLQGRSCCKQDRLV